MLSADIAVPLDPRRSFVSDRKVVDRSARFGGEASESRLALRTNPRPRMLRIMGASFAASTLRRNRPR